MNNNVYTAGDFVMARKMYGHDNPHWQWGTGLDYPEEYAVITSVEATGYEGYYRYHVRYIDGVEDVLAVEDIRLLAFCSAGEKISRDDAPLALNED